MNKKIIALIAEESTCRKLHHQFSGMKLKYIHIPDHFRFFNHSSKNKFSHIIIDLGINSNKRVIEISDQLPTVPIIGLANKMSYKRTKSLLKIGVRCLISKKESYIQFDQIFRQWERYGAFISPLFAVEIANHFSKKQYTELDKLPKRRAHIARELLKGLSYKEVAKRNYISVETVRDHVKKIYTDLNVHSRAELMNYCKS